MHTPTSFIENDRKKLIKIMRDNAFATIVTTDADGLPVATPLPFLVKLNNDQITLQAHFAKANSQWQHLEQNTRVLVIFNGPHCYISPSWYKNGGVPTWNYVSVHAYGAANLFDAKKTAELIEELSDKYEELQESPWKAKSNYSSKMLDAIVGFEINVQYRETLIKFHIFWQRQKIRIKAWSRSNMDIFQVSITQGLGFWLSPTG